MNRDYRKLQKAAKRAERQRRLQQRRRQQAMARRMGASSVVRHGPTTTVHRSHTTAAPQVAPAGFVTQQDVVTDFDPAFVDVSQINLTESAEDAAPDVPDWADAVNQLGDDWATFVGNDEAALGPETDAGAQPQGKMPTAVKVGIGLGIAAAIYLATQA